MSKYCFNLEYKTVITTKGGIADFIGHQMFPLILIYQNTTQIQILVGSRICFSNTTS